ncbi:hypothetical protein ES703_14949 [subsurface metagenome]
MYATDFGKKRRRQVINNIQFRCDYCGRCCSRFCVRLTSSEVKRLMAYNEEFIFIIQPQLIEGTKIRVMAIPFKPKGNEKVCVFLDENNRCGIYSVRPSDCRNYPFYMIPKVELKNFDDLEILDDSRSFNVDGVTVYLFYDQNCAGVTEINGWDEEKLSRLAKELFEDYLEYCADMENQQMYWAEITNIQKRLLVKATPKVLPFLKALEAKNWDLVKSYLYENYYCKRILITHQLGKKLLFSDDIEKEITTEEMVLIKNLKQHGHPEGFCCTIIRHNDVPIGTVFLIVKNEDFDPFKNGTINIVKPYQSEFRHFNAQKYEVVDRGPDSR